MTSVPGPSAVTTALAVSGLPVDRFCFEGFLPRKGGERRSALAGLADERRTMVFFESPHRLADALADAAAAFGGGREAAVCRELTKTYEEIRRGPLAELAEWAAEGCGEITLVVAGAAAAPMDLDARPWPPRSPRRRPRAHPQGRHPRRRRPHGVAPAHRLRRRRRRQAAPRPGRDCAQTVVSPPSSPRSAHSQGFCDQCQEPLGVGICCRDMDDRQPPRPLGRRRSLGELASLGMPEAVVLEGQLVLGPGEVDARDEPPVVTDGELRDG